VGKYISRRTLEKYWTAETTLQDAHQVVDQGPYGRIRHPIYISAMMMYLGWLMVFPIWLNGVGAVLVIAAYTLKTKDEDEYLQEHLSGYQEYSKEVLYRLIPRIW
jgi:protein-S-isoprenylcysteine O-methyltransferase Ste14